MKRWLALLAVVASLAGPKLALGAEPTASFALIIGVNRAADRELPALRYADDDAARYQDLFRLLGARTLVLARVDANTRRVHAQTAAEASLPERAELERAVARLAAEVRRARRRKIRTLLYFVYAGHGNVKNGEAYVLLEDARLNGARLAELLRRIGADQSHLIVDACHSGLLAMSRGPGGKRRPLRGFSRIGAPLSDQRIGLLLSSSSGRESHEWEGFQAGVFSHEVRSGLYGAADANGDGLIAYREIAAFIERANQSIPNERFRPDVYARPPRGSTTLADARAALKRRLEVRQPRGAHYVLESGLGVRLADFHPSAGHPMRILRPVAGKTYLRELERDDEYPLPAARDVIRLADLDAERPRVAMRGAAHEAFSRLFSLPFDQSAVERYRFRPLSPPDVAADTQAGPGQSWRRPLGVLSLGLSAAALTTGTALAVSAHTLHSDRESGASQASIAERNQRVEARQRAAYLSFGIAGAAAVTGIALLLWPDGHAPVSVGATPRGASLGYGGRF